MPWIGNEHIPGLDEVLELVPGVCGAELVEGRVLVQPEPDPELLALPEVVLAADGLFRRLLLVIIIVMMMVMVSAPLLFPFVLVPVVLLLLLFFLFLLVLCFFGVFAVPLVLPVLILILVSPLVLRHSH